jgi:serine phosphatase RsbU (regulator of sigma subunit)
MKSLCFLSIYRLVRFGIFVCLQAMFLLSVGHGNANGQSQPDRGALLELQSRLAKTTTDTGRVNILCDMTDELIGIETDKALEYAREALKIAANTDFDGLKAKVFRKLGNCYYYQYQFDSAVFYYNNALRLYKTENDKNGIAVIEMNLGLIFHIQSKYPEAIAHYSSSLALLSQLADKSGMADCYNNLGVVYYAQGNFEKALENYFNSLKISEELGNKVMEAGLLANIGGIYEAQGKHDKALEFYQKGNVMAIDIDDKILIASTYRNIGGIMREKQGYDSSMMFFEKAMIIYEQQNDLLEMIITYNNIGELLVKKYENVEPRNDFLVRAENYFTKSLKLNTDKINDLDAMCLTYQGLGEVKKKRGDFTRSVYYTNKALEIAKKIESAQNLKTTYEKLSDVYALKGDYFNAFQSHVLFKNWSDSVKSDEKIEMITQMAMQHDFDKQQEIQRLEAAQKEQAYQQKLKQQRLIRTFILSGLAIVLLFTVQVMRSYQQKKRDNILLAEQKEKIEKQKEEITDSIKYAKRIQSAVLPSGDFASQILDEYFILFRPRDIVSGDYYWMNKVGNKVVIVAADCTGHGVPGAFMSMLGVSFLNEIVNKNHELIPAEILNQLRAAVKRTLGQTGKDGEAKDGMDIALCVLDTSTMELQYAGAYNPLYLYRNGELLEYKADKMPIGIYVREKESFTNNVISLEKGDTFYIFSDGYVDQFGGETGGKFKTKAFKELLGQIQSHTMAEQREILNTNIDNWRGKIDQIDDIIVLGVRV